MAALRASRRSLASAARGARRAREADGAHTAFSWLATGLTATATPGGRLLPAVHALDLHRDWILFDRESAGRTWAQRLETYADSERDALHVRQLPGTQGAQREVLDLLLEHLPRRYPDSFEVVGAPISGPVPAEARVRVSSRGFQAEYRVGDYLECPLRLASLLVQEDLVLMRGHELVAGVVHFSFSRFGAGRFGMGMEELHRAVPQYNRDLQRPVTRIFDRLSPDRPCWRTNWNLAWDPQLLVNPRRYPHRAPDISADERAAVWDELKGRVRRTGFARAAFLKVEYQTLRRLPRHVDCMLFTVRTFIDSFRDLAHRPAAARNLATNVRRLEEAEFATYLGVDDEEIREALLAYSDSIATTGDAAL